MHEKQKEMLSQIRSLLEETSQLQLEYWKNFSTMGDWQFWAIILMLIVPLTLLLIFIDKRKILLLGFFGLNYHIWFQYANATGISFGLWEYPYQFVPFLPSFALDASLVPISYILLYQWTLNNKKNIYIYAVLISAFFAFVFKPIMVSLHLFHMFKGINYFHLFLFYILFFIVSKLITSLFLWLQEKGQEKSRD
ncbi:CBO0543 family protein [Mesobacillus harenae]|uniref:CBO0543 family protein n=1 Tax=Mesobacillus harenae TaxID=2213203 RepID=UPI0015809CCB|nr:CBO0543 family protein [Mesobacillus harenae]